jgi:hypothetical protein
VGDIDENERSVQGAVRGGEFTAHRFIDHYVKEGIQ